MNKNRSVAPLPTTATLQVPEVSLREIFYHGRELRSIKILKEDFSWEE